jgi:DNA modification methylase
MTVQLIQGDCLVEMATLESASIDMVFTDPPYGHNNNNNGDLISRWEAALGRGDYAPEVNDRPIANDGIEANELFKASLPEYKRLLKSDGCCCCCCGGGGGPDPQFARWSLWLDEVLSFKQMVVWDKGPMGMGWHYRRSYETVLVAHKGNKCNWYDDTKRVENVIRPHTLGIRKIIPNGAQHPTEKPWQLAAHFIKLHSREGDTILDPFMGHGSTGEACVRLGRNFIGIELSPEFYAESQRRIAEAQLQVRMEI